MRRKTVTKRVRMNTFLEARSLGGFLASVPDHLGVDGRITGMPAVAWKQPCASPANAAALGSGTWGSGDFCTSCKKWPDVRSAGSAEARNALSCWKSKLDR